MRILTRGEGGWEGRSIVFFFEHRAIFNNPQKKKGKTVVFHLEGKKEFKNYVAKLTDG